MSDYTGAVAALKTRLVDNWTTTPFGFVNEAPPATMDANGSTIPWVLCEVVSLGSAVRGAGTPNNHVIVYDGAVKLYVFVPDGAGTETGLAYAVALGDIFKNQVIYDTGNGCYVRTGYPSVEDGNAGSDDGLWFGVTASIPFEYWHRG